MKPINRKRTDRRIVLFSGNGNQPKMNNHLSLIHFEINFHDIFALAKISILIITAFWWIKTVEEGNQEKI